MKNLTDLPEGTLDEIREKLHCYFSERNHLVQYSGLLGARMAEIDKIINRLIDKSAEKTLKKHKITPVKLNLK